MNQRRNTIIIALLVILVTIIGYAALKKMKNQHRVLTRESKRLEKRLLETAETAKMLDKIKLQYDELNARWQSAPKKILNLPEPALTVSYIVWMIEHYDLDLEFDFNLESMARASNIANFTFLLSGEADYKSLYEFVYYLTVNPLLYTITKIELGRVEESDKIAFSMQINGFFMKGDTNNKVTEKFEFSSIQPLNREQVYFDIFKSRLPVVKKSTAPVMKKIVNQLDVEQASLVAMTSQKAYFLDDNGKMFKLAPGDAVAGGRLMHLNFQTSQAVFVLNDKGRKQIVIGLDTPLNAEQQ